jgi:hypothetical protein
MSFHYKLEALVRSECKTKNDEPVMTLVEFVTECVAAFDKTVKVEVK